MKAEILQSKKKGTYLIPIKGGGFICGNPTLSLAEFTAAVQARDWRPFGENLMVGYNNAVAEIEVPDDFGTVTVHKVQQGVNITRTYVD